MLKCQKKKNSLKNKYISIRQVIKFYFPGILETFHKISMHIKQTRGIWRNQKPIILHFNETLVVANNGVLFKAVVE